MSINKYISFYDRLIGYWPLNGNSINKVSEHGQGTQTEMTYTTGKIDKCAVFNGSTSKIDQIGNVYDYSFIQNTGIFTINLWVKFTNYTTIPQYIMGNTPTSSEFGFYLGTEVVGRLEFAWTRGGGNYTSDAVVGIITDNNWFMLTVVGNGTRTNYYKNGQFFYAGVNHPGYASGPSTSQLSFGKITNFGPGNLNGQLEEIAIWSRALDTTEILRLYNNNQGFKLNNEYFYESGLITQFSLNRNYKNKINLQLQSSANQLTYDLGLNGYCGSFNGSNSYVVVPNQNIFNTNTITLNAWIKVNAFSTIYMGIFDKYVGSTSGFFLDIPSTIDTKVRFGLHTNLGYSEIFSPSTLLINNWYMITATYDGSVMKIYLNGQLQNSATIGATIINANDNLYVGGDGVSTFTFNGLIDEPAVWNRALSSLEITSMFNLGAASLYYGLLAFWQLDNNTNDFLGKYNATTSINITHTTGKFGQSAIFNGTSSRMITDALTGIPGSNYLSISLWFNTAVYDEAILISQYSTGIDNNAYYISLDQAGQGTITFGVMHSQGDAGNQQGISSINAYSLNVWNHLVCVFDGTAVGNSNKCKIYLNNTQLNLSFVGTWGSVVNPFITFPVWIGAITNYVPGYYNGQLDSIGVWNKALTANDINILNKQNLKLPITYQLAAYYPFNGNSTEELNTGNNGLDTQISYGQGYLDRAAIFNGIDSYIRINQIDSPTSTFTFACWIKFNTVGTLWQSIVRQGHSPINFDLRVNDLSEYVVFIVGTGAETLINTGIIATAGVWQHLTATYNWTTSTFQLYINAELKSTANFSAAGSYSFNNTSQAYNYTDIGRNINNNNSFVNGQMDETAIWTRILSSQDITEIYQRGLSGLSLI